MSPKPALNSGTEVPIGKCQVESTVIIWVQTETFKTKSRRNVSDLNMDKDTLSKKM
jgi:hypothetical protein